MKNRTYLMLSASLFLAVGLMGCAKDRNTDVTKDHGTPTSMELKLAFRLGSDTRATADPNATDAEAALKTADVYIYSDGGAYLTHTHLAATDFTQKTGTGTADVWETSKPIATTTGAKQFYVGVNLPADAASSLENQSLQTAATKVQTIARTAINTTNGLPMFSTAAVRATLVADATTNKVTAIVKRIVAKVTVEKDPAMTQEGGTGTLGQLMWVINNLNSKYFLLQGSPSAYADPNWTAASYLAGDFSDGAAADYVNVNNGPQTPVSNYNALYALENTSDQKTMKELTRVTVRATWIPAQWVTSYTKGSGTATPVVNTSTTPVTFYTVVPSIGSDVVYFQNKTDADNYAADKGVTSQTYTDGYCYWNVFPHKDAKGDVLRNDFYKLNIKRLVAPGQPTSAVQDPNAQPSTDTAVTVDVNVLYWNTPIQDNVDLVP